MTEIPEHLLARSAKARKTLTGEAPDSGGIASDSAPATPSKAATTPRTTGASAPVVPSPIAPPEPEPIKPWVKASNTRQKIPVWIAPVLIFLPIWFAIYWATLESPTREAQGPLAVGTSVYTESGCAGCHGSDGGGGVGPALNGGEVLLTFTDWESQVAWILNGSPASNGTAYGDAARAGGQRVSAGGMPGFAANLEADELLAVVLYERVEHGGQDEAELAILEAAIDAIENGDLALEFEEGMTGDDVAAVFDGLDLAVEETAAE